jgi:hypothetical protein
MATAQRSRLQRREWRRDQRSSTGGGGPGPGGGQRRRWAAGAPDSLPPASLADHGRNCSLGVRGKTPAMPAMLPQAWHRSQTPTGLSWPAPDSDPAANRFFSRLLMGPGAPAVARAPGSDWAIGPAGSLDLVAAGFSVCWREFATPPGVRARHCARKSAKAIACLASRPWLRPMDPIGCRWFSNLLGPTGAGLTQTRCPGSRSAGPPGLTESHPGPPERWLKPQQA